MFGKLILLFILVPLTELYLLIWISQHTSIWFTLGLIFVTGMTGMVLARQQGIRTLLRAQESLRQGRVPTEELQNGLIIAFAAALLLAPGVLTDLAGVFLLMPWTRERVRKFLARHLAGQLQVQVFDNSGFPAGATVDARFYRYNRDDQGPSGAEEVDFAFRPSQQAEYKTTVEAVQVRRIE